MSSPRSTEGAGPRGVAVLGSTGSIGRQALDVLALHPDAFRIVALAAGTNDQLLAEQVARWRPTAVALGTDTRIDLPPGTSRITGDDALTALAARDDVDIVIVATGGIVSLRPVIAALEAGKVVATANKETLVAGGHLVMPLARSLARERARSTPGDPYASPLAWLRPIDSEHSAIWQCLVGEPLDRVAALILTASGGPFLDGPADLSTVTPEQALRHPTWSMGAKITIDSATLANKGLEVIEAHWLYDVEDGAIEVVVHPQSVVHSAVRFVDGSLKAQLGTPDMRTPIQYALTYPDRRPSPSTPVETLNSRSNTLPSLRAMARYSPSARMTRGNAPIDSLTTSPPGVNTDQAVLASASPPFSATSLSVIAAARCVTVMSVSLPAATRMSDRTTELASP